MEYVRENIPYGVTTPCRSPLALEAYAAVSKFCRDIFPGWLVQIEVSKMIGAATGKTWTATNEDDWKLLLRKFGGGQ